MSCWDGCLTVTIKVKIWTRAPSKVQIWNKLDRIQYKRCLQQRWIFGSIPDVRPYRRHRKPTCSVWKCNITSFIPFHWRCLPAVLLMLFADKNTQDLAKDERHSTAQPHPRYFVQQSHTQRLSHTNISSTHTSAETCVPTHPFLSQLTRLISPADLSRLGHTRTHWGCADREETTGS